jgi:hypothetical protein
MINEMSIGLAITAIISIFALAGAGDYQDAVDEEAIYCKMVNLHKISNGKNGWPDYQKNYAKRCQ